MGKTGLIQHCFQSEEISSAYYTFFVDIYATKSLREFTYTLSKVILKGLKPYGRRALDRFISSVLSLQAGISFDVTGNPSLNFQLGEMADPGVTLEEIFTYLSGADKPCIVAVDEFQQITLYPEKNVEALLRTYIQHCNNARFIFAGSQRHTMGNIFTGASRPFYQSVSMMHLESIDLDKYTRFAVAHFKAANKDITVETIAEISRRFYGVTWYIQKVLNELYSFTPKGETCGIEVLDEAVSTIIETYRYTYQEILYRLPEKQKSLLIAIAKEREARAVTSGDFVRKYALHSSSSVQSALKALLEKDIITTENGNYQVYDQFLGWYLREI
jgi:hypothetical protein